MPIAFVGDVHGQLHEFADIVNALPPDLPVVQVGDLWLAPPARTPLTQRSFKPRCLKRRVRWIDGNHDWFPWIRDLRVPTEVRRNFLYMPRGTVEVLDGRVVGYLGGAESPDRACRVEGLSWFRDESIRYEDQARFSGVDRLDILVTHTPPAFVVRAMIGVIPDPSSRAVEQMWEALGKPTIVCGHMHEQRTIANVHVLPELGTLIL